MIRMILDRIVDEYITDFNPLTIEIGDKVEQVRQAMEKNRKGSAVVVENGIPTYFLEGFKLAGKDPSSTIRDLVHDKKIAPVAVVKKGYPYKTARNELRDKQARVIVVVEDTSKIPMRISGTVSPYDQDYKRMKSQFTLK